MIRRSECLTQDLKESQLKEEDGMDRERWRNANKMPDPQISCSRPTGKQLEEEEVVDLSCAKR